MSWEIKSKWSVACPAPSLIWCDHTQTEGQASDPSMAPFSGTAQVDSLPHSDGANPVTTWIWICSADAAHAWRIAGSVEKTKNYLVGTNLDIGSNIQNRVTDSIAFNQRIKVNHFQNKTVILSFKIWIQKKTELSSQIAMSSWVADVFDRSRRRVSFGIGCPGKRFFNPIAQRYTVSSSNFARVGEQNPVEFRGWTNHANRSFGAHWTAK